MGNGGIGKKEAQLHVQAFLCKDVYMKIKALQLVGCIVLLFGCSWQNVQKKNIDSDWIVRKTPKKYEKYMDPYRLNCGGYYPYDANDYPYVILNIVNGITGAKMEICVWCYDYSRALALESVEEKTRGSGKETNRCARRYKFFSREALDLLTKNAYTKSELIDYVHTIDLPKLVKRIINGKIKHIYMTNSWKGDNPYGSYFIMNIPNDARKIYMLAHVLIKNGIIVEPAWGNSLRVRDVANPSVRATLDWNWNGK